MREPRPGGYQVTAGEARAELESMVTGCGARWEGRPAALAAEADVLITMLPGPGEVHDMMAGFGGAGRPDRHAGGLAREYQVPHELSAVVECIYHHALSRYGPVGGELLAVALLEEEAADHRLRPAS